MSSDWREGKDPSGRVFYYNIVTNATSFTKPVAHVATKPAVGTKLVAQVPTKPAQVATKPAQVDGKAAGGNNNSAAVGAKAVGTKAGAGASGTPAAGAGAAGTPAAGAGTAAVGAKAVGTKVGAGAAGASAAGAGTGGGTTPKAASEPAQQATRDPRFVVPTTILAQAVADSRQTMASGPLPAFIAPDVIKFENWAPRIVHICVSTNPNELHETSKKAALGVGAGAANASFEVKKEWAKAVMCTAKPISASDGKTPTKTEIQWKGDRLGYLTVGYQSSEGGYKVCISNQEIERNKTFVIKPKHLNMVLKHVNEWPM